jgi:hypothetical protein
MRKPLDKRKDRYAEEFFGIVGIWGRKNRSELACMLMEFKLLAFLCVHRFLLKNEQTFPHLMIMLKFECYQTVYCRATVHKGGPALAQSFLKKVVVGKGFRRMGG